MDTVNAAGGMKAWLFHRGLDTKAYNLANKGSFTHTFYDTVVFKKIRNQFGGNLRIMITASAPIAGEVLNFYKLALGIHVHEAYG